MNKKTWIKQLVRDSYNAIAPEFHQTRQKRVWPELEILAKYIRPGDCILDLGCGNGRLLKALPTVNVSYHGIEANEYLLAQARTQWPEQIFDQGELPELTLQPDSYQAVFMIAVFQHLVDRADRLETLKKIYDSLKPGGYLLMTNWWLWQPRYLKDYFHWFSRKLAWNDFFVPWGPAEEKHWRYYHAFTHGELQRLLRSAGFILESQKNVGFNIVTVARKV
jgi:ubiquinone/menaquinone biosynthesis C-methylase UbiE